MHNVWNRSTWAEHTLPLWSAEQREAFLRRDARPRRATLDAAAAVDIFQLRADKAVALAARYGVAPKTVRDIWARRTWAHATARLAAGSTCASPPNTASLHPAPGS